MLSGRGFSFAEIVDIAFFVLFVSREQQVTDHCSSFLCRLRLREEVDILKHLSDAAARSSDTSIRLARRHPNILSYIDSWEEDETLYIQTELCELGNFAHFLWEYGRAFPRLDEARVWKIIAELAAGLRFIHDANVIHLDLKPANCTLRLLARFRSLGSSSTQ